MARKIRWNKRAITRLIKIKKYLIDNWSVQVTDEFTEKVYAVTESLKSFPYQGSLSLRKKGYRRLLITKHNLLIYRITKNEIIIVTFYDTRRNPKRNKY